MSSATWPNTVLVILCGLFSQTGSSPISYIAQACDGDSLFLFCPPDHEIQIVEAFYGRNDTLTCIVNMDVDGTQATPYCSQPEAPEFVRALCEGREECEVPVHVASFTDSSICQGGYTKFMKVLYSCHRRVYSALLCEASGAVTLACPERSVIQVLDGFYGRQANRSDICPHESVNGSTETCWDDRAVETLKARCDGRYECEVNASNAMFNDACVGMHKYLAMEYSCVGCENDYGDDAQCDLWANKGECLSNREFMMLKCRKSCSPLCADMEPDCVNVLADEDCEIWARDGVCDTYPTWAIPYCRKSCLKCDRPLETAECVDKAAPGRDGANCTSWGHEECRTNPNFMLPSCTATCFGCHEDGILCTNRAPGDQCEALAADNACDLDPGFMITNCTRSCIQCQEGSLIRCENAYDECATEEEPCDADGLCAGWVAEGFCDINPAWMLKNCFKACMGCHGAERVFTNKWSIDADCEYWRSRGDCETSSWMWENCAKACTRSVDVEQDPETDRCVDVYTNEGECGLFASEGDCYYQPAWMFSYCARTCSACDYRPSYDMIGSAALPGGRFEVDSPYTFIFDQPFPAWAVFSHISVFFISQAPIKFQVFRPDGTTFRKIYELDVMPSCVNCMQTVPAAPCFYLRPHDRLGFTFTTADLPIAYIKHSDIADEKILYYRPASSQSDFGIKTLPGTFSLAAAYDISLVCDTDH